MPSTVLHIPHASQAIPAEERAHFLLDDTELDRELLRMTDHFTDALFALPAHLATTVSFPISRLVLDCHSFPSVAHPYELDQGADRPDICLGTDAFHTPPALLERAVALYRDAGYSVEVDRPFAGALVPSAHYQRDARVQALMVEVNRGLYMDERTGSGRGRSRRRAMLTSGNIAFMLINDNIRSM